MLNDAAQPDSAGKGNAGRIHPLWLTYDDPVLEANYKASWRNAARSTNRVWAFCALVFYGLIGLVLYRLDPVYFASEQWFRLYVCLPLLLIEFLLACWPSVNKRLFDANYLVASLACFGNAAISHGVAPPPLQFFFLLEVAVIFVFCGSYFRATYPRVAAFVAISLIVATPIVLYVHIIDETDLARLIVELSMIAAVASTIMLMVYHREMLSRRNFRDIQQAKSEEATAKELAELAVADSKARSDFLSMVGGEIQLTVDNVTQRSNAPVSGDTRLDGYLADIHQSAVRLQKTVQQIMKVAADKSARQLPKFVHLLPRQELEAAIDRNQHLFINRPAIRVDDMLPPDFRCLSDQEDLHDILDELISNAAKHAPDATPVICSLKVSADGLLQISVQNDGKVLDRVQLQKVFNPFVQLDDRLERASEGLGLGLPLSRKLAEINGGRLELESPPSGGIVATLELPAA